MLRANGHNNSCKGGALLCSAWQSLRCLAVGWSLVASQAFAVTASGSCPVRLRVAFPDFAVPPIFNGQGPDFPEPAGQLVDFFRRAMQLSGCDVPMDMVRRPMRRLYYEAERQAVDWISMASYTPERARAVVFPQHQGAVDTRLAVYVLEGHLYKRKEASNVLWDGHTLQLPPGGKVGVPAGTVYESLARQFGWDIDLANGGPQALEKLLAGRTPVVLISDATVWGLDDAKESRLEPLPGVVDTAFYFAAPSHAFFRRYPQFSRRIWQAMCQMARSEQIVPGQQRLMRCPR